jgi:antitoxin (DNA-binding transcriptional repressor) of toxin-antitoxin stability system
MDAHTNILRIGVREFRTHLPEYLLKAAPVAITRHGETVGYYIPTRRHPEKEELEALKQAAFQLEKLLASHGISEEELLAEFRDMRAKDKRKKG